MPLPPSVEPLDLIRALEKDVASISERIQALKAEVWQDRYWRLAAEDRLAELLQLADPDHDGRPYADTVGRSDGV